MQFQRFTNPVSEELDTFRDIFKGIAFPTIQFSAASYTPKLLKSINLLCKLYGERLDVRFFGHYGSSFDAKNLRYLPDVKSLLIDCIDEVENIDEIFHLGKLSKISFGVLNYSETDFLSRLNSTDLHYIRLDNTRKNQLDLADLTRFKKLNKVGLSGHTTNISALGSLDNLKDLSLRSIGKSQSLEFISAIPKLQTLELWLGGRTSIAEVKSDTLRRLKLVRIRALNSVGNLGRFQKLETLTIQDQIKIENIDFAGSNLESFSAHNCKSLVTLDNLENLRKIRSFSVGQTKLDLDRLENREWPISLKKLSLYSRYNKEDEIRMDRLRAKGFQVPQSSDFS